MIDLLRRSTRISVGQSFMRKRADLQADLVDRAHRPSISARIDPARMRTIGLRMLGSASSAAASR